VLLSEPSTESPTRATDVIEAGQPCHGWLASGALLGRYTVAAPQQPDLDLRGAEKEARSSWVPRVCGAGRAPRCVVGALSALLACDANTHGQDRLRIDSNFDVLPSLGIQPVPVRYFCGFLLHRRLASPPVQRRGCSLPRPDGRSTADGTDGSAHYRNLVQRWKNRLAWGKVPPMIGQGAAIWPTHACNMAY